MPRFTFNILVEVTSNNINLPYNMQNNTHVNLGVDGPNCKMLVLILFKIKLEINGAAFEYHQQNGMHFYEIS